LTRSIRPADRLAAGRSTVGINISKAAQGTWPRTARER
jgi:hypothetical protein